MTVNNKCVYLHRRKSDGIVFYVGMGEPGRPYDTDGRNRKWYRTAIKHGYTVEIVRDGLTDEEACTLEIELIASYRDGEHSRHLANIQSGGKGYPKQPKDYEADIEKYRAELEKVTERKAREQAAREQKEADACAMKVAKWKVTVAKRPYLKKSHFSPDAALSRAFLSGRPHTRLDALPTFLRPSWVPAGKVHHWMPISDDPVELCTEISLFDYWASGERGTKPEYGSYMHDYRLRVTHALETVGIPAWMIPPKGDFTLARIRLAEDEREAEVEREEWEKRKAEPLAAG